MGRLERLQAQVERAEQEVSGAEQLAQAILGEKLPEVLSKITGLT